MRRRFARLAVCLSALVAFVAGASAYFTATGTGSAQASVAAITGPSNVTAQQSGTSIAVSWSAATLSTGGSVQGYRVTRSDSTNVCGTPTLVTVLQCTDTNVPSGTYTYTVTAVYNSWDASATSAAITVLTAPTLSSTPPSTSASSSASFSFSGGGTAVTYQCQLDGGGFSACASPESYGSLAGGSHTFMVRAVQGSSTGPSTSYIWTISAAAPKITAEPAATSASAAPSFSFSDSAYTSFKCQLDGGGFTTCASPKSYSGLAGGSHTFQVEALDANGVATSAASDTWTINTAAPTITSEPANPSFSATGSFNFSDSAYTSFKCQLDGGGFTTCASPKSYSGLAGGSHTFQVEALDANGVATTAAAYTWKTGLFFRASSTAKNSGSNGATTVAISVPSGVVAGDVMVAIVATTDTSNVPAAPSGWTLIRGLDSGVGGFSAFWHIATTSEPSSYTFTNAATTALAGAIDVYAGENTSSPIQASASATGGAASNPVAPSVTTTSSNALVIVATGYGWGGNPDTAPSGTTGRGAISAASGLLASVTEDSADFLQAAAGATASKTFTLSSETVNWGTMTIALNPA